VITLTLTDLTPWLNAFWWPFVRMLALISVSPVFGEAGAPARVKIGLAALLAAALAPALPALPPVAPASYAGLAITAQQVLIGIAMGFVMKIAFAVVQTAGELMGLSLGLSFASFFDPSVGASSAVLARIFHAIALLLFLALDGHLLVLAILVRSFDVLPVATTALAQDGWAVLLAWGARVTELGLLLALPLVAAMLIVNLALGILNRTATQLSVFSVGFPISLCIGAILLTVMLPQITPDIERLFQKGLTTLERLLPALAGDDPLPG